MRPVPEPSVTTFQSSRQAPDQSGGIGSLNKWGWELSGGVFNDLEVRQSEGLTSQACNSKSPEWAADCSPGPTLTLHHALASPSGTSRRGGALTH